jgi:hypothetical protein
MRVWVRGLSRLSTVRAACFGSPRTRDHWVRRQFVHCERARTLRAAPGQANRVHARKLLGRTGKIGIGLGREQLWHGGHHLLSIDLDRAHLQGVGI